MGHKGRRQKKKNHNPPQHNQPHYTKATEQQLQIECLELYQLICNKTKILKDEELDYCYLLSTKWLEAWKEYVGFYNISQDDPKKHKKIGKKHPGKINFQLTDSNKGYCVIPEDLQEYQFMNVVVSTKKEKNDDYIAVAKSVWEAFAARYDHIEIKRPKKVTKKGNVLYDGQLMSIDCIIVDYTDQELIEEVQKEKNPKKDLDDQFPFFKIQLPNIWQLKQLNHFFEKYCSNVYNHKKFTAWKGQGFITTGALQRQCWTGINSGGKKFPISARKLQGKKFQDLDVDEFLKIQYTLVIQVGESRGQTAQIPQPLEGYCEECVNKKQLIFSCECNEVFYCSDKCRTMDQAWHYNICPHAYDSDDDEEYRNKKVPLSQKTPPLGGLDNLGNTCYMNSVIQSLLSISELTQFFVLNQFQKEIDPKQFQDNKARLVWKLSKTCKKLLKNTNTQKYLSPWSLKGQVDYFLPPFKGFKQHDANDFMVHFINAINEQLKKKEGNLYHQIFAQNFIGSFNSFIKCPQCTIEIANDQMFTQVTLPIKSKAKQLTTTYVIYEDCTKILRGKCHVEATWEILRKKLNLKDNCLLMATRQGENLIELNQDPEPQKVVKKLKREIIFYPNCKYAENDQFYSIIPITEKNIYGQRMKAAYGYPGVINIDPAIRTVFQLWIQILHHYCPEQIYLKALSIKQEYEKALIQYNLSKQSSQKLQQTQKNDQNKQKNFKDVQDQGIIEIQASTNEKLNQIVEQEKIKVFINDMKKNRNICSFCNKKCNGCQLPIRIQEKLSEFFKGKKSSEITFEILIPEKIEQIKQQKNIAGSDEATLQECMRLFTQPQQLDEQNAWYCEVCNDMRLALKQLTIKRLPKILVLHLNRFKTEGDKRLKNIEPVEYNEFQEFCGKKYRLLSVVVHEGSTEGGHYWAICLRNNKYYIFNDTKVTETQKICNKNAYILIYRCV